MTTQRITQAALDAAQQEAARLLVLWARKREEADQAYTAYAAAANRSHLAASASRPVTTRRRAAR